MASYTEMLLVEDIAAGISELSRGIYTCMHARTQMYSHFIRYTGEGREGRKGGRREGRKGGEEGGGGGDFK